MEVIGKYIIFASVKKQSIMKKTLREIIDIEFREYGYDEIVSTTETDTDIIVAVPIDDNYCDASIIFDLSGILQDIGKDWNDRLCTNIDETYNLPYVSIDAHSIVLRFNKEDYDNIVK